MLASCEDESRGWAEGAAAASQRGGETADRGARRDAGGVGILRGAAIREAFSRQRGPKPQRNPLTAESDKLRRRNQRLEEDCPPAHTEYALRGHFGYSKAMGGLEVVILIVVSFGPEHKGKDFIATQTQPAADAKT
ncbi:MAG: hypothetical protein ACRD04_03510 [Terriglobales bacterium]